MRPPALMRGPSRKPRCQGSGGPPSRATSISAVKPTLFAPAQRQQALGDEGAVQPFQRHHVGDGAERHEIKEAEQIRLGPLRRPEAAAAQFAVDRHHGDEGEPDGGEMAEPGQIVAPVGIDHRQGGRQVSSAW